MIRPTCSNNSVYTLIADQNPAVQTRNWGGRGRRPDRLSPVRHRQHRRHRSSQGQHRPAGGLYRPVLGAHARSIRPTRPTRPTTTAATHYTLRATQPEPDVRPQQRDVPALRRGPHPGPRPRWTRLRASQSIQHATSGNLTSTGSEPTPSSAPKAATRSCGPTSPTALDLSLEKYFGRSAYVSAAACYKLSELRELQLLAWRTSRPSPPLLTRRSSGACWASPRAWRRVRGGARGGYIRGHRTVGLGHAATSSSRPLRNFGLIISGSYTDS